MAPDGGLSSIAPRSTTSWTASGRESTPATQAAANAPRLWPTTAAEYTHCFQAAPGRARRRTRPAGRCSCGGSRRLPAPRPARRPAGAQDGAKVEPEVGQSEFAGPVDLLAEHGLRLVQRAGHTHVLDALTREQEDNLALARLARRGDDAGRLRAAQCLERVLARVANQDPDDVHAPVDRSGGSTPRPPVTVPGGCAGARRAVRWLRPGPVGCGRTAPAAGPAPTDRTDAAAAPGG